MLQHAEWGVVGRGRDWITDGRGLACFIQMKQILPSVGRLQEAQDVNLYLKLLSTH